MTEFVVMLHDPNSSDPVDVMAVCSTREHAEQIEKDETLLPDCEAWMEIVERELDSEPETFEEGE